MSDEILKIILLLSFLFTIVGCKDRDNDQKKSQTPPTLDIQDQTPDDDESDLDKTTPFDPAQLPVHTEDSFSFVSQATGPQLQFIQGDPKSVKYKATSADALDVTLSLGSAYTDVAGAVAVTDGGQVITFSGFSDLLIDDDQTTGLNKALVAQETPLTIKVYKTVDCGNVEVSFVIDEGSLAYLVKYLLDSVLPDDQKPDNSFTYNSHRVDEDQFFNDVDAFMKQLNSELSDQSLATACHQKFNFTLDSSKTTIVFELNSKDSTAISAIQSGSTGSISSELKFGSAADSPDNKFSGTALVQNSGKKLILEFSDYKLLNDDFLNKFSVGSSADHIDRLSFKVLDDSNNSAELIINGVALAYFVKIIFLGAGSDQQKSLVSGSQFQYKSHEPDDGKAFFDKIEEFYKFINDDLL